MSILESSRSQTAPQPPAMALRGDAEGSLALDEQFWGVSGAPGGSGRPFAAVSAPTAARRAGGTRPLPPPRARRRGAAPAAPAAPAALATTAPPRAPLPHTRRHAAAARADAGAPPAASGPARARARARVARQAAGAGGGCGGQALQGRLQAAPAAAWLWGRGPAGGRYCSSGTHPCSAAVSAAARPPTRPGSATATRTRASCWSSSAPACSRRRSTGCRRAGHCPTCRCS
jgi:hypothetical protein